MVGNHEPLKVARPSGEDFMVMSSDDWGREQETLYAFQNTNLMKQIAASLSTHGENKGYQPSKEEMGEITGLRG